MCKLLTFPHFPSEGKLKTIFKTIFKTIVFFGIGLQCNAMSIGSRGGILGVISRETFVDYFFHSPWPGDGAAVSSLEVSSALFKIFIQQLT